MKDVKEMNLTELNDTLKKIKEAQGKMHNLRIKFGVQALSDKNIFIYVYKRSGELTRIRKIDLDIKESDDVYKNGYISVKDAIKLINKD